MTPTLARNLTHVHLDQPIKLTHNGTEYSGLIAQISHGRHHPRSVHILIESSDHAVIRGSLYIDLDHEITFTGDIK